MAKKRHQTESRSDSSSQRKSDAIKRSTAFSVHPGEVLMLLGLVLVVSLVYSNTLEGPFVFDDVENIPENPRVHLSTLTMHGIMRAGASSRPVATISFALNYYFHQFDVIGYHIINMVIHSITGILLYFFVKVTLSMPSLRLKYGRYCWIPGFAALIWLAHPLHTQSVSYIVQRMNSMAAMFYLMSFLFYVKGRLGAERTGSLATQDRKLETRNLKLETRRVRSKIQNPKSKIPNCWYWYTASVLAWILALGSKENTVTLPFVIILYEWYFFQDLSLGWLRRTSKYFAVAIVLFLLIGFMYLGFDPGERIAQLTDYANNEFTITERALTQFRVVVYYLSLIFFPHPSRLNIDYDFTLSRSLLEPVTTTLCLFAVVGLVGLAVWTAKKERLLSFGILWFLGNLVIESSVIPLAVIYEHRTYLPSMPIIVMAVVFTFRYLRPKSLIVVGLSLVAGVYSFWTYERNTVWADEVALWKDCVEKSPQKARPHLGLGVALERQGEPEEAAKHFSEAVRLRPDFPEAHNSFGNLLWKLGNVEAAVHHYREALRTDPNFATAHNNLGNVLASLGRIEEGMNHYRKALELRPEYADAHHNLGFAFMQQGNTEEAISHYSEAIRLRPGSADLRNKLGNALVLVGNVKEAIVQFSEALRIEPDQAKTHYCLANALLTQGAVEKAVHHYTEALRIEPDYAEAHNNLGIILARQGNLDQAINHFSAAVKLQPDFAEAHYNLGNAFLNQGGIEEATHHFAEALRLKPDHSKAKEKLDALLRKKDRTG